jgi:hypothetical protein
VAVQEQQAGAAPAPQGEVMASRMVPSPPSTIGNLPWSRTAPDGAQADVEGRLDDHTGWHLGPPPGTTDTAAKSGLKRLSTGKFRFNLVATNRHVIATSFATVIQAALTPVASSVGTDLKAAVPRSPGHDGPLDRCPHRGRSVCCVHCDMPKGMG